AAFHDGINIARRDVQVELAARAGLDVPRFLERLDDPDTEQSVLIAGEEAEALGIKGVPALVIAGEWLMPGARALAQYRQVIGKPGTAAGMAQIPIFVSFLAAQRGALTSFGLAYDPNFPLPFLAHEARLGQVYLFTKDVIDILGTLGCAVFLYFRLVEKKER